MLAYNAGAGASLLARGGTYGTAFAGYPIPLSYDVLSPPGGVVELRAAVCVGTEVGSSSSVCVGRARPFFVCFLGAGRHIVFLPRVPFNPAGLGGETLRILFGRRCWVVLFEHPGGVARFRRVGGFQHPWCVTAAVFFAT